ncbi:YCII-related domain protein [Aspergillus flavus]|nr:YCII-related domain protein [Aspergillus flavus]
MPDKPDMLGLRKQVKGAHYEGIKPLIAAGKLVDGGAILETHSTETDDAKIKGSMVVYTAENEEEVRGIIEKDVYATSGVWDLEKVQIWPYVPAVREPVS